MFLLFPLKVPNRLNLKLVMKELLPTPVIGSGYICKYTVSFITVLTSLAHKACIGSTKKRYNETEYTITGSRAMNRELMMFTRYLLQ